MTEAETSWRACCSALAGYPTPPMVLAALPMTAGPATTLPARERAAADAAHEAGHVIVGLGLGWAVEIVTIDGPPHVRWRAGCRPLAEITTVALAGGIAERWWRRWIIRADDKALLADLARVRGLQAGSCDACRAARAVTVETGHAADAAVIGRLRELEAWTIKAIQSPPIWRAIRAIATKLMADGTMAGDATEATCRKFFNPGTLARPHDWRDTP